MRSRTKPGLSADPCRGYSAANRGCACAGNDDVFFSSRGSNLDATDYDGNGMKLLQDGLPVTTADGNNHNRVIDPLSARSTTVARGATGMTYGASTLGGAISFVSPTPATGRASARAWLALLSIALTSCSMAPLGQSETLEVVPVFLGSTFDRVYDLEARFKDAKPGQSFEDIWGPADPMPSCNPRARFIFAFLLKSSKREVFRIRIGRKHVRDKTLPGDSVPKILRMYPVYATLTNGVSRPIYAWIRKVDDNAMNGRMIIEYRDRVLFEQPVKFDCEQS